MGNLLEGKVAIITGASMGIGAKTAELFVQEGAKVVITARRPGPLQETVDYLKSLGGDVLGVQADAASAADCKKVFDETIKIYGQIDILVNNAGTTSMQTIDDVSDEEYERVIGINQNSVFYYCREAIKYMKPRNQGAIINVSSTNSLRPLAGIPYIASKFAVNGMTRSIAFQFAGTGIRCNCVCPGPTNTPMYTASVTGESKNDEFMSIIMKRFDVTMPISEAIEPAQTILFLASDLAYGINGAILAVDRGLNI